MSKRKSNGEEKLPKKTKKDVSDGDDDFDDEDDMLNVDFEWFDPQPAVDFQGMKTLLRQLFDVDNQLFDLSELTDMILAQPMLGSTVKCEGNESDPYAFLTVLNMHQHRGNAVIKQLSDYLVSKIANSQSGLQQLKSLLSPHSTAQVGLVLTERFINMPHQVVPPMYKMLLEELQWALEDKEPYNFTHYLLISKTYTEVASALGGERDGPQKKQQAAANGMGSEVFYFHPEDEALHKHALAYGGFDYSKQDNESATDSKRAFQELGVRPQGHLILVEAKNFESAVKTLSDYLGFDK